MSKTLNRVRMTTATTGTGTITLGSAQTGFQSVAAAGGANADVYSYFIEDGTAWEVGTGTYTSSGTTLSRTLLQSSTGSLLNLSGSAVVTIAPNQADLAPLLANAFTNPTLTGYTETRYAPAAGSAFTVNLANGTIQSLSLNANGTITLPASVAGTSYLLIVTYSGAYTVTWAGGGTLKWAGGTAPTATSVSGKFDIFSFFCDGTNTYGAVFGLNY